MKKLSDRLNEEFEMGEVKRVFKFGIAAMIVAVVVNGLLLAGAIWLVVAVLRWLKVIQ